MPVNVIFPSGYSVEVGHLRQQLDEAHYSYWTERTRQQQDFKIENIRFRHVPGWNRKVFSIQSAHDANHWIWKATRVFLMGTGQLI
jgi:hypothetical protein